MLNLTNLKFFFPTTSILANFGGEGVIYLFLRHSKNVYKISQSEPKNALIFKQQVEHNNGGRLEVPCTFWALAWTKAAFPKYWEENTYSAKIVRHYSAAGDDDEDVQACFDVSKITSALRRSCSCNTSRKGSYKVQPTYTPTSTPKTCMHTPGHVSPTWFSYTPSFPPFLWTFQTHLQRRRTLCAPNAAAHLLRVKLVHDLVVDPRRKSDSITLFQASIHSCGKLKPSTNSFEGRRDFIRPSITWLPCHRAPTWSWYHTGHWKLIFPY